MRASFFGVVDDQRGAAQLPELTRERRPTSKKHALDLRALAQPRDDVLGVTCSYIIRKLRARPGSSAMPAGRAPGVLAGRKPCGNSVMLQRTPRRFEGRPGTVMNSAHRPCDEAFWDVRCDVSGNEDEAGGGG